MLKAFRVIFFFKKHFILKVVWAFILKVVAMTHLTWSKFDMCAVSCVEK